MSNTSATGGYLTPSVTQPLPDGLTLDQFLHNMILGISGFTNATLVRPKFQVNPPKTPALETDWIAFAVVRSTPDANAYVTSVTTGTSDLLRNEMLEIQMSFYGPNAQNNVELFRDGFQITQNLESLSAAKMGFTGFGDAIRGPDLVNERWRDRWETSLMIMRQVQRTYAILSFVAVDGTVSTVVQGNQVDTSFDTEDHRE